MSAASRAVCRVSLNRVAVSRTERSEQDQDQAEAEGDPGTNGVQARATEHGAVVLCGRGSDLGAKT
jgi:hypothetical protein